MTVLFALLFLFAATGNCADSFTFVNKSPPTTNSSRLKDNVQQSLISMAEKLSEAEMNGIPEAEIAPIDPCTFRGAYLMLHPHTGHQSDYLELRLSGNLDGPSNFVARNISVTEPEPNIIAVEFVAVHGNLDVKAIYTLEGVLNGAPFQSNGSFKMSAPYGQRSQRYDIEADSYDLYIVSIWTELPDFSIEMTNAPPVVVQTVRYDYDWLLHSLFAYEEAYFVQSYLKYIRKLEDLFFINLVQSLSEAEENGVPEVGMVPMDPFTFQNSYVTLYPDGPTYSYLSFYLSGGLVGTSDFTVGDVRLERDKIWGSKVTVSFDVVQNCPIEINAIYILYGNINGTELSCNGTFKAVVNGSRRRIHTYSVETVSDYLYSYGFSISGVQFSLEISNAPEIVKSTAMNEFESFFWILSQEESKCV